MNDERPTGLLFEEIEAHERGFARHFRNAVEPKLSELETARVAAVMAGREKAYRQNFKRAVVPEILGFIGGFAYEPEDGISPDALYASKRTDCRRILAEIHKVLEIVDTLAEGVKAEAT